MARAANVSSFGISRRVKHFWDFDFLCASGAAARERVPLTSETLAVDSCRICHELGNRAEDCVGSSWTQECIDHAMQLGS